MYVSWIEVLLSCEFIGSDWVVFYYLAIQVLAGGSGNVLSPRHLILCNRVARYEPVVDCVTWRGNGEQDASSPNVLGDVMYDGVVEDAPAAGSSLPWTNA